jgi:hypothetical protein
LHTHGAGEPRQAANQEHQHQQQWQDQQVGGVAGDEGLVEQWLEQGRHERLGRREDDGPGERQDKHAAVRQDMLQEPEVELPAVHADCGQVSVVLLMQR